MFEDTLYSLVKSRGLKITWLAEKSKMKYFPLYESLRGRRELRSSELYAVCNALNISLDELEALAKKEAMAKQSTFEEVVDA